MKRKITIIVASMLFALKLFAGTASIPIASGASITNIQDAISNAVANGDSDIVLQFAKNGTWGTGASGGDISIAVPAGVTKLTFTFDPATSGATPILYLNTLTYADALMTEGITFDGLKVMTGTPSRYLIQPSASTANRIPSKITFKNCWIEGYRSVFSSTIATVTTELTYVNNTFKNLANEGAFRVSVGTIQKVNLRNNTFINVGGDASGTTGSDYFIDFRSPNSVTSQINFSNNTIYYPRTQGRGLFRTSGNFTTGFLKENNNIYSTGNASSFSLQLLYNNASGTTTDADSTNYFSNKMTLGNNKGGIHTTVYVENSPSNLFLNPGADDFTINDPNFAGLNIAGDPKWFPKQVSNPAVVTTAIFPLNAGSVSPSSVTVDEGTDVQLTATRNYGYQFKEWQDSKGNVLSSNATNTFNISKDTTIIAIFDPITTYTYTVDVQGSQWGRVQLTPAPVDGKYETGTVVNMTVVPNAVTNFLNWEDNTTQLSRVVVVNENKSFTATFDERPFIVGWDFKALEPRGGRSGDFYAESANMGSISLHEPNGNAVNWLANAGSFTPSYPCVRIWTAGANFATTRRYFQASFSTEGYNNVNIKSMVSGNYQVYSVQKMQYSLNGTDFTDLASADITTAYNSGWVNLDAILPTAAENQSRVYIRWIADVTSTILGNSVDNDGMALTNIYVYADKLPVIDNDAPVLLSTVPANNANNASANGSITLTFDERMKLGTGACTLNGVTLTPSFGSKTVTFAYSKLTYNTDYTFVVPAGALTDMAGNPFAGTSIQFRTMNRPQPLAKTFDFVVAKDGSGDGTTIQSAFSAVPVNNATPFLIFIKNGVYAEYASLPSNKPNVHIIGQSRDNVIITGSRFSGLVEGGVTYSTSTCQTLELMANNVYMENVTVRNTAGVSAGQAVALKTYGDRCTFNNIKLTGYQDTHLTGSGRQWYLNSDIHGTVDYIFGGGDVFFETCLLYNEARSGGNVIVAPNTGGSLQWGYVFSSCTIDGDVATQNNQYLLGRPWQNSPRAVFINTRMNILPAAQGWTNMGVAPALFAEYNSMTANGQAVDVSNRRSSYTTSGGVTTTGHQTVLTDVQAAQYTRSNVLSGNDSWDPTPLVEKTANPTNVRKATGVISWDVVDYAISYIVLKNNVAVHFTTSATYTDAQFDNMAEYKVVAVAESGTLSEATLATDITSNSDMSSNTKVYAYFSNNDIIVENLSSNAKVTAYALNGLRIGAYTANSNRLVISNAQNCILQIVDNDKTTRLKMIR